MTIPLRGIYYRLAGAGIPAAVFVSQGRAQRDCSADGSVCGTSLDPPVAVAETSFGFIGRAFGDALSLAVNNLLITIGIAFVLFCFFLVVIFLIAQPRQHSSKRRTSKSRSEASRAALVQKLLATTSELDESVQRIQSIVDRYSSTRPDGSLVVRPGANEDAAQILKSIGRELVRVSNGLTNVRRDVSISPTSNPRTQSALENGQPRNANSENGLEIQRSETRRLNQEVIYLSKQLSLAKAQSAEAFKAREEAAQLLSQYLNGLPKFLSRREEGSHYPSFIALFELAQGEHPEIVSRIKLMLRVLEDTMLRDDNGSFEIAWSAHEIGKGLYGLMQSLGHDSVWQYQEASAWAAAMNKYGAGRFSIYVPAVDSVFNGLEMTGGTAHTPVTEVKSWGVKNRRGDVERKAVVR